MRMRIITICFLLIAVNSIAQNPPRWYNASSRESDFSKDDYYIGFAEGNVRKNETEIDAVSRIKKEATGLLVESIRLKVQSVAESYSKSEAVGDKEQISSKTQQSVKTTSEADIVGIKVESHYDKKSGIVAALAYVKRDELVRYYNSSITLAVQQVEGFISTALELEKTGAKAKARKQLEEAKPLLGKIAYEQDLLIAMDNGSNSQTQHQDRTSNLRSELEKNLTRLEQSTFVYIKSTEDLFGKKSNVIVSKLKAKLATDGCSFVDDPAKADFYITLNSKARKFGNETADIKFCYVDLEIDMVNTHQQKSVYSDEISQKGGAITHEAAARKAAEDIAPKVAEKILPWIKNL